MAKERDMRGMSIRDIMVLVLSDVMRHSLLTEITIHGFLSFFNYRYSMLIHSLRLWD